MPDTPPLADIIGWAGALIGGIVAGLGLKLGERDKKTAPAPEPQFAGITANLLDSEPFRSMAADVKAILTLLAHEAELAERRREEEEKDAIKDRLDRADRERNKDRDEFIRMIDDLRQGGAQHAQGRPLRG